MYPAISITCRKWTSTRPVGDLTMMAGQWMGQDLSLGDTGHFTLLLYTVHCTLYTIHCKLYTVHATQYTVHCKLHTVQFIPYTVHCTLYNHQVTLNTIHCYCTLFSIHLHWNFTLSGLYCTLAFCTAKYTLNIGTY